MDSRTAIPLLTKMRQPETERSLRSALVRLMQLERISDHYDNTAKYVLDMSAAYIIL
jgi:hypothetical protein